MKLNAKVLTFSGLFIALGLVLPQIFHLFGGTGPIFLPMHIPVLLAGFFIGAYPAALVGLLTVILSSVLTGMPAIPVVYFMIAEVTAYGFLSGFFYKKMKLNVYTALLLAMILGRVILGATVYILQPLLALKLSPSVYMSNALISGIPGIIIQIVFIPAIVFALERFMVKSNEYRTS
ncbi:MAG: ECF transporter S component [Clostridiaceae bacterium]